MQTKPTHIDYFKALHLRQVGLALASLWVILLVAAVAATIYREFDGPTIRSTVTENLDLSSINSKLNQKLITARNANDDALGNLSAANETIDRLNWDLKDSRSDYADLISWLESYLTSVPLMQISP